MEHTDNSGQCETEVIWLEDKIPFTFKPVCQFSQFRWLSFPKSLELEQAQYLIWDLHQQDLNTLWAKKAHKVVDCPQIDNVSEKV